MNLPIIDCGTCTTCCGPVLATEKEFRIIQQYAKQHGIEPVRQGTGKCCFAYDGKCQVHPVRPLTCRIFGHYADPDYTCPYGKQQNVPNKKIEQLVSLQIRKEGAMTRWVNEMAYTEDEMREGLEMEIRRP